MRAVMDAVGTDHAALFGYHEGGPMSMLFAATYPERTRSLALFGTYAVAWVSFLPDDRREAILTDLIRRWGGRDVNLVFLAGGGWRRAGVVGSKRATRR
jgi:pimeloyl-ACP methyl ester carboxylesterase